MTAPASQIHSASPAGENPEIFGGAIVAAAAAVLGTGSWLVETGEPV
jgi:hypothetical protein